MSVKPIRVQLPGGDLYAPALHEAASKTGARSGMATKTIKALNEMVRSSVAVLNSGKSTMITLEMRLHEDSIAVKLVGKGCEAPTKRLVKELETLAAKKASSFERKKSSSARTIRFEV